MEGGAGPSYSGDKETEEYWVQSAKDLAGISSPVDDDVALDLSHLEDKDIQFLNSQTSRILDRHAEIQSEQRGQAASILRANIIIIGAIATAIPLLTSFFRSMTFNESVPAFNGILSFILLYTVVLLGFGIASDIVSIIDSTFDILSPEKTKRGLLGKILSPVILLGPSPDDKEEGGSIRSVSIFDELASDIDKPGQGLRTEVIINRLNRIRRNQRTINQNTDHLADTYQRAKLGLERIIGIFIFVAAILFLLGASI